jgi:preprotein translocase subunit YajC
MEAFSSLIPMMVIFGVFWFVLIRPQVKEKEAHEALLASLAKDDLVVTWGGLHGRIVSVADRTVVVEMAKGTQITVEKASVLRKASDSSATKSA